ncbi:MAG: HD domain-containing protein [Thermomicrobiales bacterium]
MLEKTPVTHPESRLGRTAGTGFPVSTMLRDSLYDIVPLADAELALIDAQAFLRLERVQQLGFVSRVWPGARHTRFEHSIGFHLARQAIEHLRARSDAQWITDEDARTICAAALLHDIGHYPFSHAIEELGDPVISHEQVGRAIVLGDEISPILREHWGVDPKRVASIIDPAGQQLHPADTVLRGILSGPLDVDKLDYLPRDAHACSVPYGGVDTNRLIASLIFATSPMVSATELTDNDDASLLALMIRFRMPETTRRLANALQRREIHKRAVEIGAQAADLYDRVGALFHNPAQCRTVELGMTRRLEALLANRFPMK